MFDQFTTDLPSSLSDRVCRLGIVPEENNFVLAHAHVQLYRVHAGEESGGGGGCSVLTSSLGRRGQRSEVRGQFCVSWRSLTVLSPPLAPMM